MIGWVRNVMHFRLHRVLAASLFDERINVFKKDVCPLRREGNCWSVFFLNIQYFHSDSQQWWSSLLRQFLGQTLEFCLDKLRKTAWIYIFQFRKKSFLVSKLHFPRSFEMHWKFVAIILVRIQRRSRKCSPIVATRFKNLTLSQMPTFVNWLPRESPITAEVQSALLFSYKKNEWMDINYITYA